MFRPHERLEADTTHLRDLPLCQVRLMDNRLWPWLILVPRRSDVTEIHHLDARDRAQLVEEVAIAARTLEAAFRPHKINVGALGNLVPQLHVHVVARHRDDPAWPGPVWGSDHAEPYGREERDAMMARLNDALGAALAG